MKQEIRNLEMIQFILKWVKGGWGTMLTKLESLFTELFELSMHVKSTSEPSLKSTQISCDLRKF